MRAITLNCSEGRAVVKERGFGQQGIAGLEELTAPDLVGERGKHNVFLPAVFK